MNPSPVQCPDCQAMLSDGAFNRPEWQPCPQCRAQLQIEIFPALFRPLTPGSNAETAMVEGESTCFYHPNKKAVRPCEGCGRFVCALCDCELHGQHYCPTCLEVGRKKGKIRSLENHRTLYDSIALSLAILPLLFFYFTIITAPMAVYIALRYWNAPRSIIHRTKVRFVIAIALAMLQIGGWAIGGYFLISAISRNG
jgi:hypothetical protein